jgi:alpha-ketoglutarate-dependent taurine dioxygenase
MDTQLGSAPSQRNPRAPIAGATAWLKRDLAVSDYVVRLSPECILELTETVEELNARRLPTIMLTPAEYPMPACQAAMARVRSILEYGCGFALVDRLPLNGLSAEQALALYWLLSSMIARPVAQKLDGTMIYDVHDTGLTATAGSGIRRDKTKMELSYHTDNSYNESLPQYVALLCVRPARSGGLSKVISLHSVHNEVLRRDLRLLNRLYRPYLFDRQREHLDGEPTVLSAPVFWSTGDQLCARISLHLIRAGYTVKGDAMDKETVTSLDLVEEIFEQDMFSVEFQLEPGVLEFTNNLLIGHSRTAFDDYPEPARKRWLIRLWLRQVGRQAYSG